VKMEADQNKSYSEHIRELKVLIIEDDEFVSMIYQDHLDEATQATFNTESYTELEPGLAALEKGDFDILLLDLNLPDSDYNNTISTIPSIAFKVPIIIMTSTNDEKLALKTMNLGAQDYLNKDKLDKVLFIRSILYSLERHQLKLDLQKAQQKSDELIHNILPSTVIQEIKEKGTASAKEFKEATILFTDFVGFTKIGSKLSPSELVQELDVCFKAFDEIVKKYGLEKIKTIGDAYLAVGGLSEVDDGFAKKVVLAGLEMQDYIKLRKGAREKLNLPAFEMRIGIHTGSVVAGIVGTLKFQYDIWGDAVNVASRMESNGEVGEVNVSSQTYDLLRSTENFVFTGRGEIDIKGKGMMEMWRVNTRTSV